MAGASKESREIGYRIRQIRLARGKTQQISLEVRKKYGVKLSPNYLSRMERGQTEIPLRTLFALADYLEVHPNHLIDPYSGTHPPEIDYLFKDNELLDCIALLKIRIGETGARRILKTLMSEVLNITEDLQSRR